MDATNKGRTGRSIFELAEIRPTGSWQPPRPRADRPADPVAERSEPRSKSVGLNDRQLTLAIGAVEHVMAELRRLPGTEAPVKEYESCLIALRQALAVLPPGQAGKETP
jgi:hypothetical protein